MLTILLASPIYHTTYPPFGVASSSFIVFTSFLINLGRYSSGDCTIRKYDVAGKLLKNMQYLNQNFDNIGFAEMQQEIGRRVLKIVTEDRKKLCNRVSSHFSLMMKQNGTSTKY
jgi:hypothetical protein